MITTVLDLDTGKRLVYTLPPEQAVAQAFRQSRGDWNTWIEVDVPVEYGPSDRTVFAGSFGAAFDGDHSRKAGA